MFSFVLKCVFITTVIGNQELNGKKETKHEIKIGKVVGLYSDLNEAKLDIERRGIHAVPLIRYSENLR